MKKILRMTSSNNQIVILLMILSFYVFFLSGCQQSNNPANSNTATNQANTTANTNQANTMANSNTSGVKSIRDEILGTWIQQESGSAKVKMVFTKDEYTKLDNDTKEDSGSYKWRSDKELEMDFKGQKIPVKVTIAGDEMTLDFQGIAVPYKRESANTVSTANIDGAVFTNKADVKGCDAEPGWKTCKEMTNPSIKIFGSRLASESALNGVANTYSEMTKHFNSKYPKDKFNGYKIYLTNGEPWSELSKISPVGTLWTDQTGPMSGDFLRGGTTENYLWIDEQMICKTGIRTRNEAGTPDNDVRTLDQVVHEFGHAIDYRYKLDGVVNTNFNSNPDFPATERFPWGIQNWFGTPAGNLNAKEEAVIKDIFSSRVSLKCEGYKP